MTRPQMTVGESLKLIGSSLERSTAQFAFEYAVAQFARKLWKLLVNKVGEPKAKETMRRVMGDKQPGRPSTPQEDMLSIVVPVYILKNAHESDEKIARRILESGYCVLYKRGMFAVVNGDATDHLDDPTLERKPIEKSLTAMKKQVERIRREMIEDRLLPKEYSPKTYYPRD